VREAAEALDEVVVMLGARGVRFAQAAAEAGGALLVGYAIARSALVPEKGIDGQTMLPSKYEYAKHWRRPDDGLRRLGYDVVDEPAHPFSILHAGPWSLSEVVDACGPLSDFGLFDTPEAAKRFCDLVRAENEEEGSIWQVWG